MVCSALFHCIDYCTFSDGDVVGGKEEYLGTTTSEQLCAALVKRKRPWCIGATWGGSTGANECYAEHGHTIQSKNGWRACLFPGIIIH